MYPEHRTVFFGNTTKITKVMTVFIKVVLREIGILKCMHAHVTPVQMYSYILGVRCAAVQPDAKPRKKRGIDVVPH